VPLTSENGSVDDIENFIPSWEKYLGYYVDTFGKEFEKYSKDVFQSYAGDTSTGVLAQFHPSFIKDDSKIQWTLDGQLLSIDTANPLQLVFTVEKDAGDAYNILAEVLYRQPDIKRQALKKLWNITADTSHEKYFTDNAQIEIVVSSESELVFTPKALFASLSTNLPSNILFLLQLVLTLTITIFGVGLLFSLPSWLQRK